MEKLASEIIMAKEQPEIKKSKETKHKYWLQVKHDKIMTIILMSQFAYLFKSREIIFYTQMALIHHAPLYK